MTGSLIAQLSVSLDGYIEDRDASMDWFAGDRAFDQILTETVRGIDGIVFGRRAYELGAAYWPTAARTADTAEVAEQIALMNSLPKYVLTRGNGSVDWPHSVAVNLDDLPRVKADAARPLALFAGARAFQAALQAGHIDEVRLIRYPVVLGGGTALFAADGRRRRLTPVETRSFAGGPTVTRYTVAT